MNESETSLPLVITVAARKGGSGKTNLAACLGAYWFTRGHKPCFIDMDDQFTLSTRLKSGPLSGIPCHRVIEEGIITRTITETLADGKHAPLIIDTPGYLGAASLEALWSTELVIVPMRPSIDDWNSTRVTIQRIQQVQRENKEKGRHDLEFLCVISLAKPSARQALDWQQTLKDEGLPIAETVIYDREDHNHARMRAETPTIFAPRGKAANEISQLAAEIKTLFSSEIAALKEAV